MYTANFAPQLNVRHLKTWPDKTAVDGWAGAVMQKPLAIQKCDRWTDRQMDGRTDRRMDIWKFTLCPTGHWPFGAAQKASETLFPLFDHRTD